MQTVAKIMPLFLGFISWGFPAGLVLYFAVSNLFRIGQQAVIFRLDDDGGESKGKEAELIEPPPEDPKPSGPSPHASKKRKGRRRR
jgi:membrane protein insertase Oxa1/YidC/SpoIIIJ